MADPSDPSNNPCATELQVADACILAEIENCVCLGQNFLEVLPTALESSFRQVLTTQNPADPNFCQATNDKLCEFLATGSCCCTREVIEYSACILAKDLMNKYEIFKDANCSWGGSCVVDLTGSGSSSGGGNTPDQETIIIFGVAGVAVTIIMCIFSCVYYYMCCYRRREVKKKGKGIEVNIKCSKTGKTTHTRKTVATKQEKIPPAPPPEDSESSEDDFAWDDYNVPNRSQRRDIESGHSREMDDSRSERLKVKRRTIEGWHEQEKRKRRSTRSFQSYSSSDEESRQKSKRYDKQEKKEIKKEAPPKEVTVRQARTLVKEYEEEKEGGHSETIWVALIPEMREIVELLGEEIRKLDTRTKAAEEKKMRWKMELKESQAKVDELQESREAREIVLNKAKLNSGIVHVGSEWYISEMETDRKEMEKDLKTLQREREEMAALLYSLKQAQIKMESRVKKSEEVTNVLRMEKRDSERGLANDAISKTEEEKLTRQAQMEVQLLQKQTARESGEAFGVDAAAMLELPLELPVQALDAHFEEEQRMAQMEKDHMMARLAGLQAHQRDLKCQLVYRQSGENASDASSVTNPTYIGYDRPSNDNHGMMQLQFESNDLMQPTQYDTMTTQPPQNEPRGMMNQQQYQYESHDVMQPNISYSKDMMTLMNLDILTLTSESEESADYARSHQHLRTSHKRIASRRSMHTSMSRGASSRSMVDPPALDCTSDYV